MSKKKWVGIIAGVVVLAIAGALLYWYFTSLSDSKKDDTQKGITYADKTKSIENDKVIDTDSYKRLIDRYSEDYQIILNEIMNSTPAEWTTGQVEKVYFLIAYTNQAQEMRSIPILLDKLEAAKNAGVNVDVPAVGADQTYRDNMRKRAEDALKNPDLRPADSEWGKKNAQ